MEVVGTEGVMVVDAFGEYVDEYSADGARWLNYGQDPNRAMLIEFIASIREGRTPQPDGRAGMRATAIALAAYESARTNTVVKALP